MCKECPFRKKSAAGWLGPWSTPDEILNQSQSESGLACHLRIERVDELDDESPISYDESHVCVGSMLYANATFKRYRSSDLSEAQNRVKEVDHEEALLSRVEFKNHHSSRKS